jgi:adenylylsulfate kinase
MNTPTKSTNTVWHHATVSRADREKLHKHKSVIIWFTGLSGSGKSTLAHAVEDYLHEHGISTFVLDGDNVRHGLCSDLTFNDIDRVENIRRIGEVAKLIIESGVITLTAFISPFKSDRNAARCLVPHGDFIEIHCQCPIETCEQRDVKGLYKKARAGEIPFFTGIDSPYEAPEKPELVVNTHDQSLAESVQCVINLLKERGIINASS